MPSMRGFRWWVVAALGGAIVLATVSIAVTGGSSRPGQTARFAIHAGCPSGLNGETVRVPTVDQAIEVARRHVVRGTVNVQGRRYKRNRRNTPVMDVVALGVVAPLPGQRVFEAMARHRCGRAAAMWASAVVFGDALTVICCEHRIVFVVGTRRGGWFVF
jgi:hypothetical protein